MFYVKNPCSLNKPWILSRNVEDNPVFIPIDLTKHLKNYQIMSIEFLYHNYRKGIKGSILNQEPGMNFPLQVSAFLRALVGGRPALILVICTRQNVCFWQYHLAIHANFAVTQLTTKNSKETYKGNTNRIALIVPFDCIKLCEDVTNHDFFSVIIEDFDQVALKRVIKRLNGSFNIGLTCRSFYENPDQKLQWNMLNWVNPGCVGKLSEFYEIDNENFDRSIDNYRFWWMRLTWEFCESFEKPTEEEMDNYEQEVDEWASQNCPNFLEREKKTRKRMKKTEPDFDNFNEVPSHKYVKLPSMDENPIVTSIIKNFEISPEPILCRDYSQSQKSLPYTQTQPTCSSYDENSVILSFLKDEEKPSTSTSRSESEDFILNLI